MRNNKKNWEIFSKGVKNIAIVCNHIPTTPALINNRKNNMIVETMNKGQDKYKLVKSCVRYSKSQYDITTINNYFANKEIQINKDNEKDLANKIVNLVNNNIGNHANINETKIIFIPNHHKQINEIRESLGKPLLKEKYDLYFFSGRGWEVRFHKVAQ